MYQYISASPLTGTVVDVFSVASMADVLKRLKCQKVEINYLSIGIDRLCQSLYIFEVIHQYRHQFQMMCISASLSTSSILHKLLMQTLNILVQPYNTHANFALCHTTTQKYMPYCWVLHIFFKINVHIHIYRVCAI